MLLLQIRAPHEQVTETLQVLINTVNDGYIVLTISNGSIIIHLNNLYAINITASNPAGESVIIQNLTFSKYMIIMASYGKGCNLLLSVTYLECDLAVIILQAL